MSLAYIQCNRCVFKPNDRICEYRVEKTLGAGTFGCVYKVTDGKGKIFALKLLKLWEIASSEREELWKRFDMEYETGKINSNYLVHSYTKGIVEGNPYIVMEYCSCGDLMCAAESGNADLVKSGKDVLYGLRDLHKHGKVHRDLKPENVLLRNDGTAILTDFGISGDQNNRLTQRGIFGVPLQTFGTFAYMPPEQVNPKRGNATVLPTTDIFSFGVMMYYLVTTELPFGDLIHESDLVQYTKRGAQGLWNRSLLSRSNRGNEWAPLIEGCLQPDFKKRLQNADEVLSLMPSGANNPYKPTNSDSSINAGAATGRKIMLRIMQGEQHGRICQLNHCLTGNRRIITIGRACDDVENTIAIKDDLNMYISRCHCTLELTMDDKWIIRDGQWRAGAGWINSTNGTYVNSTEVDRNGMLLNLGDIITIGDVKMRVEQFLFKGPMDT